MLITLANVYDYIKEQKYPKKFSGSEKRTLRKRAENFVIKDGVMYYCMGWKHLSEEKRNNAKLREAVMDEESKLKLVFNLHTNESGTGNHLGHLKVVQAISQNYYWTGMHADVRKILKMCHKCAMNREMVLENDVTGSDQEETGSQTTIVTNSAIHQSDVHVQEVVSYPHKPLEEIFYTHNNLPDSRHFWDAVEVEILGPYPSEPDSSDLYYIAVFLDTYSGWPEAFVMETPDMPTIILAIFKLIARFGVMSEIVFRQSKYSKGLRHVFDELLAVGCPVKVQFTKSSKLETRWAELQKSVEDFIVNLPTDWFKYLEFCLLPYRISRPETLDYTPSYLSSSRELRLPTCLDYQVSDRHIELHMSEAQVTQSLTKLKDLFLLSVKASTKPPVEVEDTPTPKGDGEGMEGSWDTGEAAEDDPDFSPEDNPSPRKRKRSEQHEGSVYNYGNFYEALKNHLQGRGYPPHYNMSMKRSIRKVKSCFVVVDDVLYYKSNKGVLRQVVLYEEDRWKVLHKCHTDASGKHLNVRDTYKKVTEGHHWKGISLDTQAFTRACPQCNESTSRPKAKHTPSETVGDEGGEGEVDRYTDCTEEYKPLLEYLRHKTLPEGLTEKSATAFKTKANFYSLEEDVLYYKDSNYVDKSGKRVMRKVIFTPEEKEKCFRECHIIEETGKHKTKTNTHGSALLNYYWPHMAREVAKFIRRCEVCNRQQTGSSPATPSSVTRPRTRASTAAEETPDLTKLSGTKAKRLKMDAQNRDRKERFLKLFREIDPCGGNVQDVQSDHGYSIQSPVKSPDEIPEEDQIENVTDIAGNEVEIQTELPAPENTQTVVELSPLTPSTLEPLSAAVELALAASKNSPAVEECSTPSETSAPMETPSSTATVKTEGKGNNKYNCQYCGLWFRGPNKFQKHLSEHTGEKPFTCKICGAKVNTMKSIRQHERRHKGKLIDKRFLCDVCGKDFKFRLQLRTHKQTVHSKLSCYKCGKVYSCQGALEKHESLCNPTGLECKVCDKMCANASDFRAHMLGHVGLDVRQRLERIGPGEAVTVEETVEATSNVEDGLVRLQIELPQGMELTTDTQQYEIQEEPATEVSEQTSVLVTQATDPGPETSTALASSDTLESSLLQLAEQVVQAGLGEREVEYQILYPDNTSQIVIVQHEASPTEQSDHHGTA